MNAQLISYPNESSSPFWPSILKKAENLSLLVIFSIIFLSPTKTWAQERPLMELEEILEELEGREQFITLTQAADYYYASNSRRAVKYAREAVRLGENLYSTTEKSSDYEGQFELFKAYYFLGIIQHRRFSYIEAYKHLKIAEGLAEILDTEMYENRIENALEDIEDKIDNIDDITRIVDQGGQAVRRGWKQLSLQERIEKTVEKTKVEAKLRTAENKKEKGELNAAVLIYKDVIKSLEDIGDREDIPELQIQIGILMDSLNEHVDAQEFLKGVIAKSPRIITNLDSLTIRTPELPSFAPNVPKPKRTTSTATTTTQKSTVIRPFENIKAEKENIKEIAVKAEKEKNFEKSLTYFRLYQELSEKMFADSLAFIADKAKQESNMLELKRIKEGVDQEVKNLKRERDARLIITLVILLGTILSLYFYLAKRKEHKKLSIAYRDLDKTKNKLVGAEKRIVKLLKQHVSGDVADELLSSNFNETGERRFVCIMFLDIRDFTPMAEKLTPEELITYQNDVFGFMIDVIHKHHGNINQLLGDGFMATFGAPVSHENDCQNAFHAAEEILDEVKERNDAGVILKTKIGIGLHAGLVVTGNVGTESRKQYSVTGNPVIIASRVEQLNKTYKSQFIITEEVFNKLDKHSIIQQPFMEVEVKGRSNPVKILKLA